MIVHDMYNYDSNVALAGRHVKSVNESFDCHARL